MPRARLIARLDDALADAPLEVDTPAHGLVANRMLAEVAQHRSAFRLLLRDLRLPAEPGQAPKAAASSGWPARTGPGAPTGPQAEWPSAGHREPTRMSAKP